MKINNGWFRTIFIVLIVPAIWGSYHYTSSIHKECKENNKCMQEDITEIKVKITEVYTIVKMFHPILKEYLAKR